MNTTKKFFVQFGLAALLVSMALTSYDCPNDSQQCTNCTFEFSICGLPQNALIGDVANISFDFSGGSDAQINNFRAGQDVQFVNYPVSIDNPSQYGTQIIMFVDCSLRYIITNLTVTLKDEACPSGFAVYKYTGTEWMTLEKAPNCDFNVCLDLSSSGGFNYIGNCKPNITPPTGGHDETWPMKKK